MASKMKDSGVEWIGEIPEEWEVKRVKYLIAGIADGTHGTHERYNEGRPLLSAKNVFNDGLVIGSNESLISERDYRQIVASGFPKKDDVLVSCVGSIGRTCVYELEEPIAFQRSVVFLRPNKSITSKMLKYGMESKSTLVQEKLRIKQSAQAGIYQGDVCELFIAVPPINEQEQIIRLVESKLDKIDTAISTIEKEIDVLERYKASLIHEAVTKGLNPDVPMKDSGVEWIGEIPEGWTVKRIDYAAVRHSGHTPNRDTAEYWDNGDVVWISLADSPVLRKNKYVGDSVKKPTMAGINHSSAELLPTGCVILSRDASIGLTAISTKELAVSQHFMAYDCKRELNNEYLYYCLTDMRQELEMLSQGSTIPTIGIHLIKTLKTPLPPLEEQEGIVQWLNSKSTLLDNIMSNKEKQLDLLKRQRQSLIYEYVTGKKRVPGYGKEA